MSTTTGRITGVNGNMITVFFEAAISFARSEGIIPAPEAAHAISVVLDEAARCKEAGETKTIVFNLSGHGHFDLASYDRYLSGQMRDFEYPQEAVEASLARLPQV